MTRTWPCTKVHNVHYAASKHSYTYTVAHSWVTTTYWFTIYTCTCRSSTTCTFTWQKCKLQLTSRLTCRLKACRRLSGLILKPTAAFAFDPWSDSCKVHSMYMPVSVYLTSHNIQLQHQTGIHIYIYHKTLRICDTCAISLNEKKTGFLPRFRLALHCAHALWSGEVLAQSSRHNGHLSDWCDLEPDRTRDHGDVDVKQERLLALVVAAVGSERQEVV